ncbi:hypothetical protein MMC11_000906 [Xylographa trunciseda]|nr:hypothetical protein [Xylographa trunciseda]
MVISSWMKASWVAGLLILVTLLAYGDWIVEVDGARWREAILGKDDNSHSGDSFTRAGPHGHGNSKPPLSYYKHRTTTLERISAYRYLVKFALNTLQSSLVPISGKNLTILPLGDSITNGFQSTDGNGYRLDLVQDVAKNTVNMIGSVHAGTMPDDNNEGHDGAVITEIASNATTSLPLLPTVVLLMAGTNDMDKNISTTTAPDRLGALIDQIFTACPNTTVLVAQVTPSGKNTTEASILGYNAAIPGVVAQRAKAGMHVAVVDMYDALSFPADFADYLHPNDGGYKKMADAWYAGLQQADQMGWLVDEMLAVVSATTNVAVAPTPTPTTTGRLVVGGNGTMGTMVVTTIMTTTTAVAISTDALPSTSTKMVSATTLLAAGSSTASATSEGAGGQLCGFWSPMAIFTNAGSTYLGTASSSPFAQSKKVASANRYTRELSEIDAIFLLEDFLGYTPQDSLRDNGVKGIIRTHNRLWNSNSVPIPATEHDEALATAIKAAGPPPKPKPDITYGYSNDSFLQSEINCAAGFSSATRVTNSQPLWPFLVMEWKSDSGQSDNARFQAMRNGAAAVSSMWHLLNEAGCSQPRECETAVFCVCIGPKSIEIYISWRCYQPSGMLSWEMDLIQDAWLHKEDQVFQARSVLLNILEWARRTRLDGIKAALRLPRRTF